MQPPKGHVYLWVKDYLGIDMPGRIAVPEEEAYLWMLKILKEDGNAEIGE